MVEVPDEEVADEDELDLDLAVCGVQLNGGAVGLSEMTSRGDLSIFRVVFLRLLLVLNDLRNGMGNQISLHRDDRYEDESFGCDGEV